MKNKHIIYINESQIITLLPFINEDFYGNMKDGKMYMGWKPDEMGAQKENDVTYPEMTQYKRNEISPNDFIMRPFFARLPKSKIDCYNLYKLSSGKEITHPIKKNKTYEGVAVVWDQNEWNQFINQSVDYAKTLISHAMSNAGVQKIAYITFPPSSSDFNKMFCNKLAQVCGGQVLEGYFEKTFEKAQIDKNLAKALGCDANDIEFLQKLRAKWEFEEDTIKQRIAIRNEINNMNSAAQDILDCGTDEKLQLNNKVSTAKNGEFYHLKDKRNGSDRKFRKNSNYGQMANGVFINIGKGVIIPGKRKNAIPSGYAQVMLSNGKTVLMPQESFNISLKLAQYMGNIQGNKTKYDTNLTNIATQKEKNLAIYGNISKNNEENNVNNNIADAVKHGKDLTYNKNTSEIGQYHPEIKKLGEYARHVLTGLFSINPAVLAEIKNDEVTKQTEALVVWDDNMAGGGTMDSICYIAEQEKWRVIIPLTLGTMPITQGTSIADASKARDRNKRAELKGFGSAQISQKNLYSNGRTDSIMHNVNPEYLANNYDNEAEINNSDVEYSGRTGMRPVSYFRGINGIKYDINKDYTVDDILKIAADNGISMHPKGAQSVLNKINLQKDKVKKYYNQR
jgi:hypothetical protein